MLIRLSLQNIAIIEDLDIEFEAGFNVLTGETGSGKSLMLESIQRTFDRRGSFKDLLRTGAPRGRIELTFDLARMHNRGVIHTLLEEAGISLQPEETDLVVGRDLTPTGSRCRINGSLVTADILSKLGSLVFEMFGQHDLHTLFSQARQRDLLDNLGGESLLLIRQEVRRVHRDIHAINETLLRNQRDHEELTRQRDFLSFQIDEIAKAEITDAHEDERLHVERARLANGDQLRKTALQSLYVMTGGDNDEAPSMFKLINQLQKSFSHGAALDPQFVAWSELADQAQETLRTLSHSLNRYAETMETQPERIDQIVDRLDALDKVKRKYGGSLEAVLKTATDLEQQLDRLDKGQADVHELEARRTGLENRYAELVVALTEIRTRVGATLTAGMESELKSLMLGNARFDVDFEPIEPGESGQEAVRFVFSANPGEPLKPLAQVASGGEMARLMLALKIRTAHADGISTLILDEIDTGISGVTVRAVADKLAGLQRHCQIIAITHQPIVAAKASWHVHVQKAISRDGVRVTVTPLIRPEDRALILGRLASGLTEDDDVTRQFAQQLLS